MVPPYTRTASTAAACITSRMVRTEAVFANQVRPPTKITVVVSTVPV